MTNIIIGDALTELRKLPDESHQLCVTSPPYFGLRDYGTGKWEGGDSACQHSVGGQVQDSKWPGAITTGQRPGVDASTCKKCGASRVDSQVGLEKTPQQYVDSLVGVFREVRRVLREDGTLWLNLGDSYCGYWGDKYAHKPRGKDRTADASTCPNKPTMDFNGSSLKPKDLIGIPWRVALALQADGWYLRAACPWVKKNGMPESTRSRPTQCVEYLFMLTKSEKCFYDPEAVKLAGSVPAGTRGGKGSEERNGQTGVNSRPPEYKVYTGQRLRRATDWFFESLLLDGESEPMAFTVNTKPYKGAHFATFPKELILPCIRSGTSEKGCCPDCGAPWERVVENTKMVIKSGPRSGLYGSRTTDGLTGTMISPASSKTTGWKPGCEMRQGAGVLPGAGLLRWFRHDRHGFRTGRPGLHLD